MSPTDLQKSIRETIASLSKFDDIKAALDKICATSANDDSGFSELWYALNHDEKFKLSFESLGLDLTKSDGQDDTLFDAEKMVDLFTMRKSHAYIFDTYVGIIYSAISDAYMVMNMKNKTSMSTISLLQHAASVATGNWPDDKVPSEADNTIFTSMNKAMQSVLGKDDNIMAIKTLNDLLSKAYASRMLLKRYYMDADNFTTLSYDNAPKLMAAFRSTAKRISNAPDTPAALRYH